MKKVLYIHGAFSAFQLDSEKVINLKKDFDVVGVSYSMEDSFSVTMEKLLKCCIDEKVDFVAGTSLGGMYAAELNKSHGFKAVLVNPCVEPQMSLSTIIGSQKNYATGLDEDFTRELVDTYPEKIEATASCLFFVGMKDDLIDPEKTISFYEKTTKVFSDSEQDHRWQDFDENEKIKEYFNF